MGSPLACYIHVDAGLVCDPPSLISESVTSRFPLSIASILICITGRFFGRSVRFGAINLRPSALPMAPTTSHTTPPTRPNYCCLVKGRLNSAVKFSSVPFVFARLREGGFDFASIPR